MPAWARATGGGLAMGALSKSLVAGWTGFLVGDFEAWGLSGLDPVDGGRASQTPVAIRPIERAAESAPAKTLNRRRSGRSRRCRRYPRPRRLRRLRPERAGAGKAAVSSRCLVAGSMAEPGRNCAGRAAASDSISSSLIGCPSLLAAAGRALGTALSGCRAWRRVVGGRDAAGPGSRWE